MSQPNPETTIGFVGLGAMGAPMAERLCAAGHSLAVYNRSPAKAESLLAKGARRAATPGDACMPGGMVLSIVADDAALEAVTLGPDGLAARLGPGGLHVSMSTIAPATARRMAEAHAAHGSSYLAAPVFGRPDAAAAGKLRIVCSGAAEAKARFLPLVPAIGVDMHDFGDEVGAANVVKLAGNFLIATAIEALGEVLTFVGKNDIDRSVVAKFFGETLFACPVYRGYGAQIAEERWSPPGFRLVLGLKDVKLALAAAEESGVPLAIGSLLRDRFLASIARGDGELDWSAMALGAARDAGLG